MCVTVIQVTGPRAYYDKYMLQGAEVTLSSDLDLVVEGHILYCVLEAWIKYLQKKLLS